MLDHASDVCIVCLCLPVLLVVLTEVLIGLIHLACDVCIACCCYLVLSVLCVVANHITCSVCTYLSNEVVYIPSTVIKELDFMNHHDGLFRQSTKAQGSPNRWEPVRFDRLPVKPVRSGSGLGRYQTGPNSKFKFEFKKMKNS